MTIAESPRPTDDRIPSPLEVVQPAGWPSPRGYANGIAATGRMVFVGGQVGWDTEGRFPGGFLAQTEQALANVVAVVEAAGGDLADMETALEEYLAFARGQAGEEPGPVDLVVLCETLADDAARDGVDVPLDYEVDTLTVPGREGALKRALANLVNNAAAHSNSIRLTVRLAGGRAEVLVDDDGPGIAPQDREDAFRPFSRLDDSRNANRTGVGLGLAIARDTIRAHGGELHLETSPLGGLRARAALPL